MKKNILHILIVLLLGLSIPYSATGSGLKNHLIVSNASIRQLPPGQSNTVAFLTISNHGNKECTLLDVDSPVAKRIEFHAHQHEQGMVKMRRVETITLPEGDSLLFETGGLHLMLFGVKPTLKNQDSTQINIHTDHCGSISFEATVTDRTSNSGQGMHH